MVEWVNVVLLLILICYVSSDKRERYRESILAVLKDKSMTLREISDCLEMISDSYLYKILNDLVREDKVVRCGSGIYTWRYHEPVD